MSAIVLWQNDAQLPTPNRTTVTTGNSAGGSDVGVSSPFIGSGCTFASDTSIVFGSTHTQSWKLVQSTTNLVLARVTWSSAYTDWTSLFSFSYTAQPTTSCVFFRGFSDTAYATTIFTCNITTSNKLSLNQASGNTGMSTASLVAGTKYTFIFRVNSTAATATMTAYPYGSTTATATASIALTGTPSINSTFVGINTASSGISQVNVADWQIGHDGDLVRSDVFIPPTAAFTSTSVGMDGVFDGTTSTASSPATVSSYAWTFGDSGTGTGSNPTYLYTAPGTYSVGLTVTDSNGLTNTATNSITITAPTASTTLSTVTASTGMVSNSGSVLSALTDTSSGSPVLTTFAAGNNGSIVEGQLGPLTPPSSGQPLILIMNIDRINSTTGTIAAQIYEGTTQRSSTSASIPDMTASGGSGTSTSGTVNGTVQLTFPWTDVQNVVDWNQLLLKTQITVS